MYIKRSNSINDNDFYVHLFCFQGNYQANWIPKQHRTDY